MDRNAFLRTISVDDPAGVGVVSAALREWEPRLDLERPPRDALLYEPDGTLYAVCVGGTLAVHTDRRDRVVHPGDILVVPQAYALDAGPDVDLLAIRYDGPPPDHFRERFIQVWGFEHVEAPMPGPPGLHILIPPADVRHRVPYAILDAEVTGRDVTKTDEDCRLIVGLAGSVRLIADNVEAVLGPRQFLTVPPLSTFRLAGTGRVGILTLLCEPAHEARRVGPTTAADRGVNPEYLPPTPG